MKNSIALIGFMGTGKTAVGQALAEKLGKEFIETDALIEKKAGKSIPEIFRQDGEIVFRELEIAVIKAIAGKENVVIAGGGGACSGFSRLGGSRFFNSGALSRLSRTKSTARLTPLSLSSPVTEMSACITQNRPNAVRTPRATTTSMRANGVVTGPGPGSSEAPARRPRRPFATSLAYGRPTSRLSDTRSDSSREKRWSWMLKSMPDSAATMPAIVGSVAFETPPAMPRALPLPATAITSKTSIMPVTVPSSPNMGHSLTSVLIEPSPRWSFSRTCDTSIRRM